MEGADWRTIANLYAHDLGRDEARAAACELDALLAAASDDEALESAVYDELGCFYDPRPDLGGPTVRAWLGELAEALRGG